MKCHLFLYLLIWNAILLLISFESSWNFQLGTSRFRGFLFVSFSFTLLSSQTWDVSPWSFKAFVFFRNAAGIIVFCVGHFIDFSIPSISDRFFLKEGRQVFFISFSLLFNVLACFFFHILFLYTPHHSIIVAFVFLPSHILYTQFPDMVCWHSKLYRVSFTLPLRSIYIYLYHFPPPSLFPSPSLSLSSISLSLPHSPPSRSFYIYLPISNARFSFFERKPLLFLLYVLPLLSFLHFSFFRYVLMKSSIVEMVFCEESFSLLFNCHALLSNSLPLLRIPLMVDVFIARPLPHL